MGDADRDVVLCKFSGRPVGQGFAVVTGSESFPGPMADTVPKDPRLGCRWGDGAKEAQQSRVSRGRFCRQPILPAMADTTSPAMIRDNPVIRVRLITSC